MKHILYRVTRSRDPDARAEAISYCNSFDECSGSGRHGKYFSRTEADCDDCKRAYDGAHGDAREGGTQRLTNNKPVLFAGRECWYDENARHYELPGETGKISSPRVYNWDAIHYATDLCGYGVDPQSAADALERRLRLFRKGIDEALGDTSSGRHQVSRDSKYTKDQIAGWYGKERNTVRRCLRGAKIIIAYRRRYPPKCVVVFETDDDVRISDSACWEPRTSMLSDIIKNDFVIEFVEK